MVLLLGANGYIGQAFASALRRRKGCFVPLARNAFDYTRFEFLFDYVRNLKPELVINAGGYLEAAAGAEGEPARRELLHNNTLLPQTIARVCDLTRTPCGHVSSGSIYSGAKILDSGGVRLEPNLRRPGIRRLFDAHPERFLGYSEQDEPNCSFHSVACSFNNGTKALAEEMTRDQALSYIWRLRLTFNETEHPDNFLSRLIDFPTVREGINSLSHVDDCVRACLDLWDQRAPFGTYNLVNPGAVTSREIIGMIQRIGPPTPRFEPPLWEPDSRTLRRSDEPLDCILDSSKLARAGIHLRPVKQALEKSLENWQPKPLGIVRALA